jgi:hypothetical protein
MKTLLVAATTAATVALAGCTTVPEDDNHRAGNACAPRYSKYDKEPYYGCVFDWLVKAFLLGPRRNVDPVLVVDVERYKAAFDEGWPGRLCAATSLIARASSSAPPTRKLMVLAQSVMLGGHEV